jgi:hypothetical protein
MDLAESFRGSGKQKGMTQPARPALSVSDGGTFLRRMPKPNVWVGQRRMQSPHSKQSCVRTFPLAMAPDEQTASHRLQETQFPSVRMRNGLSRDTRESHAPSGQKSLQKGRNTTSEETAKSPLTTSANAVPPNVKKALNGVSPSHVRRFVTKTRATR